MNGYRTAPYQMSVGNPPITRRIGDSGLMPGGFTSRIEADFLRELNGTEGYKRYNEMRLNSPVIAALLRAIEYGCLVSDWFFTGEGEDDPRVEFLNEALKRLGNFKQIIKESLTCLPFGFSPFVIDYKREDGKLWWDGFRLLGQDTIMSWIWDDTRQRVIGIAQYPHIYPEPIPYDRVINFRYDVERDSPEGRSLLRPAWIPYYYTKNLQQIEAIGFERNAAGLPVITLPEHASTDETDAESDASKAAAIVRNVRVDEQAGLVLRQGWTFSLVASSGNSTGAMIDTTIKRYESRMLMVSLSQFLLLGQDRVGAQSLSVDQTDLWTTAMNTLLDLIGETFTRYAVRKLLILNGYDPTGVKIDHSPAGDANLSAVGTFLQQVSDKLTWMPEDELWLRNLANMPDVETDMIDQAQEQRGIVAEMVKQATRPRTPDAGQNGKGDEAKEDEAEQDMMIATYAAANKRPDARQRKRYEKQLQAKLTEIFDKQRARIVKNV